MSLTRTDRFVFMRDISFLYVECLDHSYNTSDPSLSCVLFLLTFFFGLEGSRTGLNWLTPTDFLIFVSFLSWQLSLLPLLLHSLLDFFFCRFGPTIAFLIL